MLELFGAIHEMLAILDCCQGITVDVDCLIVEALKYRHNSCYFTSGAAVVSKMVCRFEVRFDLFGCDHDSANVTLGVEYLNEAQQLGE